MTHIEKVKHIREKTSSPMNKISDALNKSNGDVDAAIEILIKEKQADANDMANRVANSKIVYSYVHGNRVGAMIVLACQTDFVAKNEAFLNLAKDICMHIVSTPVAPQYISKSDISGAKVIDLSNDFLRDIPVNKPDAVKEKIVQGKLNKYYSDVCLLNQPFIKNDTITVEQLIKDVSSTLGEKIEITYFVKVVAQ